MDKTKRIEELEVAKIQNEIQELKKQPEPNKRFRAKLGEIHWYISNAGTVCSCTSNGDEYDEWSYLTGNYFKTKQEAERYKRALLTISEVKDMADCVGIGLNIIEQYYLYLYLKNNNQHVRVGMYTTTHSTSIWFHADKSAQLCIDTIGQERLIEVYEAGLCF